MYMLGERHYTNTGLGNNIC